MENNAIFKSIQTHINDIMGQQTEIKPETHLIDDLGMDSLEVITLFSELEKEYQINVTDFEVENISTVEAAVKLIDFLIEKSKPHVTTGN